MKHIKLFASLVLISAMSASSIFGQSKKSAGPLDGKVFTVQATENGKKKAKPEPGELNFKGGKMKSSLFADAGYKDTKYDATVDSSSAEPSIAFTVNCEIGKEEFFKWDGSINGENIEGTAQLTKKDKVKKSYAFTGTLKSKKKK